MQKKCKKLLLSLVITSIFTSCSSINTSNQQNVNTYYDNNKNAYYYCNAESCPQSTKFTLDDEDDEPIFIPPVINTAKEELKVTVNFAFDKYKLTNQEKAKIVKQLKEIKLQNYRIEVIGYTDNVTSKNSKGLKYNKKLAHERAITVAKFISEEYKLKLANIKVISKPLCCYIDTNKTSKGRQENRRAKILIKIN